MPDHSEQIDEIFWNALQLASAADRAAYLDQKCHGDQALRALVDKLLQAQPRAEQFLEQPLGVTSPPLNESPFTEAVGTVIGPYRLLEQIGEGGFGVVFMAEQTTPVKRQVALKVIKPGMDTRQVIARFEAERQALAMMDHPNIAQVFDAGATETGRPYFVMELVKGVPITDYCDQHQLVPKERLELFVTVCQAVQHAHQKGVIHRDIKPSNVLVTLHDGKPVVKVIDFGIAKATIGQLTDRTLFTSVAQLVGTPLYMSPEQASLSAIDVDTRSDIYSLGVLLYELLTGTTPFDKMRLQQAAFDEVRRIIREEEPQKPSTRLSSLADTLPSVSAVRRSEPRKLSQLIQGDLDWIVMKALEKDRSRRYETANGFAADVLHYLADEPVAACPPSAVYRFQKFARRNRGALTVAALLTTALLLGVVGTTWQAFYATQQRDRAVEAEKDADNQRDLAQQRADEADEARAQAEANAQQARQAVDDMYTQVAEKWLAYQPYLEPLQREFLEKALRFYAESAEQRSTDPAVRFEMARAYRRVADIQHRLGQRKESEEAFNLAIDQLQDLADEFPTVPEYRQELAQALHKLGANIGNTRSHAEEEQLHRRALAIEQQLAAEYPDVPEYRRDLGRGYWNLGRVLRHRDDGHPEAEQAFRSALETQRSLVTEFPTVAEYRCQLAESHFRFGENQRFMYRAQEGLREAQKAAEILEELVADFPNDPDYRNRLANIYFWIGEWDSPQQLEKWMRMALALQQQLTTDFPSVSDYWYDHMRTLVSLGIALVRCDHASDGERCLRQATEIGERLAAESPTTHYYQSRLARAYCILAEFLRESGRLPESEAAYERSICLYDHVIEVFPSVVGFKRQEVVECRLGLARLLTETRRSEEASELLENLPADPAVLNCIAWMLSMTPTGQKRDKEWAVKLAEMAAALNPKEGAIWNTLGVAHYRNGDWTAAITALEKSMELRKGGTSVDWFFLAMARWQLGERDLAGTWYKAAQLWTAKYQSQNGELARFQAEAADLLRLPETDPMDIADEVALGETTSCRLLIERLLLQNQHAKAAEQAVELARATIDQSETLRAANYLEKCANFVKEDAYLTPADFTAVSEAYANQFKELMPDARERAGGNSRRENALAWEPVTRPESELRLPAWEVEVALKAVELAPMDGRIRTTLGVACYRAGDWKSAIASIEKSVELHSDNNSLNHFVLAMARWQLGDKDEARKCYDQAVVWMEANASQDEELMQFRAETAELLGVKAPLVPEAKQESKPAN